MSLKIYIEAYGCAANQADGEFLAGILEESGFEITDSADKSDLNLIVTCIVKTPTEHRMIGRIQELTKTGKPLVVAGCMPKTSQLTIEKINPNASLIGPDSISHIVDAVNAAIEGRKIIFVGDERKPKVGLPRIRKRKNVGIVPISIGCLSECSYCATKFARGRLKSYTIEEIVKEVERLVKDGCDEIWLTSEDDGCYGVDIGTNLATLLKKVCGVRGDFKIRVGMMNPTYIKNEKLLSELIEAYKDKKMQKFLHLPVQSGSDRILKSMKRGYTVADFVKIIERFRKEIPDLFLNTDVIVGFPGETEEDFEATIELMKKTKPSEVNISRFGARPRTEAAKMKQLPVETINERSKRMHDMTALFKKQN